MARTCSIARSRFARANLPVSSSITHRWRGSALLECLLSDRFAGEAVGENLELLLVVDRHPEYATCLAELRLEVAGVAETERPRCRSAAPRVLAHTIRIGVTAAATAIDPS
jgi:hypothetical protein